VLVVGCWLSVFSFQMSVGGWRLAVLAGGGRSELPSEKLTRY
jgi:hypothetical protein